MHGFETEEWKGLLFFLGLDDEDDDQLSSRALWLICQLLSSCVAHVLYASQSAGSIVVL